MCLIVMNGMQDVHTVNEVCSVVSNDIICQIKEDLNQIKKMNGILLRITLSLDLLVYLVIFPYNVDTYLTFVGPCILIYFYNKTNQMHNISSLF